MLRQFNLIIDDDHQRLQVFGLRYRNTIFYHPGNSQF